MDAKSWVVAIFLAFSLVAGVVAQYFFPGVDHPPTDWVLIPVFALLIFLWYRMDSSQRSYRRSPWLNIGVIGISVLALPYYFFRTRGFKGGILATASMLALFVLSGAITVSGAYAVYYFLQS